IGIDHEGRAFDPHRLLAVAVSLLPDAVLLGDLVPGVGEQRERERVLLLELDVGGLVGADAENDCAAVAKAGVDVADSAGLRRGAGRVVLGIEVENDRLSAQRRELDLLSAVARQLEIGCRLAFLDHGSSAYPLVERCRSGSRTPRLRRSASTPASGTFAACGAGGAT